MHGILKIRNRHREALCASSEVDSRKCSDGHLSTSQSWEQRGESLASPLPTQEREASDARASVYHIEREVTSIHHTPKPR